MCTPFELNSKSEHLADGSWSVVIENAIKPQCNIIYVVIFFTFQRVRHSYTWTFTIIYFLFIMRKVLSARGCENGFCIIQPATARGLYVLSDTTGAINNEIIIIYICFLFFPKPNFWRPGSYLYCLTKRNFSTQKTRKTRTHTVR